MLPQWGMGYLLQEQVMLVEEYDDGRIEEELKHNDVTKKSNTLQQSILKQQSKQSANTGAIHYHTHLSVIFS